MRHLLLIVLLSGCVTASRQLDTISGYPLREIVGFACFFEGRPTPLVEKVGKYIRRKQYRQIAALLSSPLPGSRYLAAIALLRLDTLGEYTLTDQQKILIDALHNSKEGVPTCSGCTDSGTIQIRTLLTDENYRRQSGLWLDRMAGKLNTDTEK